MELRRYEYINSAIFNIIERNYLLYTITKESFGILPSTTLKTLYHQNIETNNVKSVIFLSQPNYF